MGKGSKEGLTGVAYPAKAWTSPAGAVGAALAALVLCAPAVGQAQAGGWETPRSFSLGLAAAATHWRAGCSGATACDRNDTGWRLTGAWQFALQGALELVASDQGRVRAEALGDQGLRSSEVHVRGLGVNLAWLLPLTPQWQFAARAGVVGNRARWTETVATSLSPEESSRTRTDPALGLGLSWRLSPSVSIDGRLDWTSTRLAPPAQSVIGGGSTPSHQWGLGLTGYF